MLTYKQSARKVLLLLILGATSSVFGITAQSYAQSQGASGFDWIGTDPANIADQRCYPIDMSSNGAAVSRLVTMWTPPGSASAKYDLKQFSFVSGLIPESTSTSYPIGLLWQTGLFKMSIYDSFEAMRNNPDTGFRARFNFRATNAAASIASAPNCRYWRAGTTYPIECGKITVDLQALMTQGAAEFKTAAGISTATPLKLDGSKRYYISLIGFSTAISPLVCAVRTNYLLNANRSELPNPPESFSLSESRCAEAGLSPNCLFVLAHSDYYWIKPNVPYCDPNRTPVNFTEDYSLLPPYFNTNPDGNQPRTCGGSTNSLCCERTMPSHTAYALGVQLSTIKSVPVNPRDRQVMDAKNVVQVDRCMNPANC